MPPWLSHILFSILGLYLIHRLGLWAESKGWVYWSKKPENSSSGNALQEFNAFFRPSVKYVQEAKQTRKRIDKKRRNRS